MKTKAASLLMTLGFCLSLAPNAQAEKRFVGLMDARGNHIQFETNPNSSPSVILNPGHQPEPNLDFPSRTMGRLGLRNGMPADRRNAIIDDKFRDAVKIIQKERIIPMTKRVAALYGVDPAAVISAIIGELTFNNSFDRQAQDAASAAMPSFLNFRGANRVASMFNEPALAICDMQRSDYWSWTCANRVWSTSVLKAKRDPSTNFIPAQNLLELDSDEETLHGVLRPTTGSSYGLGQLSLVQVLMLSADVTARSGLPRITIDKMAQGLALLKTYEGTLNFIAAGMARASSTYARIAGVDISRNLGIQATLFNLGRDFDRAYELRSNNYRRNKQGLAPLTPRENYFGYYMNEYESEIRSLVR